MAVVDPLPTEAPYGVADWKDYKHNWREVDTDWMQDRSILRFSTTAQRDAKILSPQVGQFIYNLATDLLEFRSKDNVWKSYKPAPLNLNTVTDTTTTVKQAHSAAGSKGMTFTATNISTDLPVILNGGTLTADATGVVIKTGTKAATLTTDATYLISDTPLKVPAIELTAGGTVVTTPGTMSVGTLTATSISTGTLTASGVISGGGGSALGGVSFSGGVVTATGLVSSLGYFYGSTNGAIMRQRAAGGTLGAAYVQALETEITLAGTYTDFISTPRVMGERAIQFMATDNTTLLGYGGPVVYTATALSAANYPNGTIWITP